MQTTLLDSYPPTLREISWNTRREWSIDCDRKECRSNSRYQHWIRTNLELWSRILGTCQQRLRHCPHAKVWRCRLYIAKIKFGWTHTGLRIQPTSKFDQHFVPENTRRRRKAHVRDIHLLHSCFSSMPSLEVETFLFYESVHHLCAQPRVLVIYWWNSNLSTTTRHCIVYTLTQFLLDLDQLYFLFLLTFRWRAFLLDGQENDPRERTINGSRQRSTIDGHIESSWWRKVGWCCSSLVVWWTVEFGSSIGLSFQGEQQETMWSLLCPELRVVVWVNSVGSSTKKHIVTLFQQEMIIGSSSCRSRVAGAVRAIHNFVAVQVRKTHVHRCKRLWQVKEFIGKEDDLQQWSKKIEALFVGMIKESEIMLEESVTPTKTNVERGVSNLGFALHQMHTSFMVLTSLEANDIVAIRGRDRWKIGEDCRNDLIQRQDETCYSRTFLMAFFFFFSWNFKMVLATGIFCVVSTKIKDIFWGWDKVRWFRCIWCLRTARSI